VTGSLEQGPDSGPGGLLRGPPAYRSATPWRAGPGVLATVAIVGVSLLVGLLLARFLAVASPGALETVPGRLRLLGLSQLLMVALTLLASALLGGRSSEVLALRAVPGGWRTYTIALLGLMALQLLLSAVQRGVGHDVGTDVRQFVDLVRGPDWPLAAAVVAIGAPLAEELVFRGFLLSALATRLGFWGAALLANLPWTALHWGYSTVGLVEVFILGLFFSWLLWRTGSLRVPILCHAIFNGLVLLELRYVDLPASG